MTAWKCSEDFLDAYSLGWLDCLRPCAPIYLLASLLFLPVDWAGTKSNQARRYIGKYTPRQANQTRQQDNNKDRPKKKSQDKNKKQDKNKRTRQQDNNKDRKKNVLTKLTNQNCLGKKWRNDDGRGKKSSGGRGFISQWVGRYWEKKNRRNGN